MRTFTLPDTADQAKISAEYKDGILFISVAKREEAKILSREITID
jgi:HSP20 family protein